MDGAFRGQQRQGILAVCRAFGPDQVCTTGHARRPQPFFCFDTGDWSVEPWLWRRAGCGCLSPAPTALDSGERRVHENVLDRVLKIRNDVIIEHTSAYAETKTTAVPRANWWDARDTRYPSVSSSTFKTKRSAEFYCVCVCVSSTDRYLFGQRILED